jgi:hypothetical protein
MAVLVAKIPQKRYLVIGGMGLSQSDREQADRLDGQIETQIAELVQKLKKQGLMPSEKGKGSLRAYWELGRALRNVSDGRNFPHKAELPLLWRNVKLYVPEVLLYQNRGPYREHLWYCYRLGGYSETLVSKMKWGEWVTVFDSNGINQEPRFDVWFQQKLTHLASQLNRECIRMFAPCVNEMLGNIDSCDLTDSELYNCYESAWQITATWHAKKERHPDYSACRKEIQRAISDNLGMLDQIMEGTIAPEQYAETIVGATAK